MSDKHDPSSFQKVFIAVFIGFFTYLFFPVLSSVVSAYFNQDARFDPQRNQGLTTPSNSPTKAPGLPIPEINIPTPSPVPEQTPKPEPTISGEWVGTYTCSQRITGVTVVIDQTRNTVIADFHLYPPSENSDIPREYKRYEGSGGRATYKGDFNSISRYVRFPEGEWSGESPGFLWRAFGFQGQFDEKLETFSGKMDHHSCTTINLKKKGK
jgi:hypothetical protein